MLKVDRENIIGSLLKPLCEKGIHSVLVEGGAATINELISEGLWDEARVFTGDKIFHSGIRSPELKEQELVEKKEIGNDMLNVYKRITNR